MSKPLDPRLLRRASSARWTILATVGLSLALTGVVVATALTLARALGPLVTGAATVAQVRSSIVTVALLVTARALLQFALTRIGNLGASAVIAQLRRQVLERMAHFGPRWAASHGAGTGTLLTRGLDALGPYFTSYVPQLMLSVILTPALLVVMATQDLLAAITLAVAIPLIPIFMWLIGVLTAQFAQDRLTALTVLGRQLLDLVAGLPTLRAFGRALGPAARVRELADRARRTTMATLRVAFLSGAVLELIATIAVAMVAVGVGLRLVAGEFDLITALAVLIMAPEVLVPLRQVGVQFHNAADGVAAADHALDLLHTPAPRGATSPAGTQAVPDVQAVQLVDISVRAGDRAQVAPAGLNAWIRPGRITVLIGASGAGKSTAVNVLLGLLSPDSGQVRLHLGAGSRWVDLADTDPVSWWGQLTWVPQRPTLEPGTLTHVVTGAQPADATGEHERDAAAKATGLLPVVDTLDDGWQTVIGHGGARLSLGQRQRVALTRGLLAPARYLILDEPTAHLDSVAEDVIIGTLRRAAAAGKGVLVIAHRPALRAIADDVITVVSADGSVEETARGTHVT